MTATETAPSVLHCRHCGEPIIKRSEGAKRYLRRLYCSIRCTNSATKAGKGRGANHGGTTPRPTPHVRLDDPQWFERGACRRVDPELFFHPEGEMGAARGLRDLQAKKVCFTCPVVDDCRRYALATHEAFGVWGATTETERAQLTAPPGGRV